MYLLTSGESLASASSCVAFSVESATDCNDFSCSTCVLDFSPSCFSSIRQITTYPPSAVQRQRISPPHSAQTYSIGKRYGMWPKYLSLRPRIILVSLSLELVQQPKSLFLLQ